MKVAAINDLSGFGKCSLTADMTVLARYVAKKVENEMEYPGQIKVNVIRESRVIDYAK